MVSTFQVTGIPPPTCALVPANTATWRYRVSLEWSLYRAKKFFDRCLIRVVFFGLDSKSLMLSWVSRQPSLRKLQWVRRKAFHVGFLNVPELILSPEEFDFGVDKRIRNQFHVGPLIDLERRESLTDPSLQQLAAQIDKDRTVLYCTFGTLSLEANKGKMSRFISQLIKGVASRPKWTLVLSADKSILPTDGGESSNVLIYDWMPQLWFLNHCKVVITHGGLNSTMEALSFGCPLLAVPLNDQWDQPGNAARIEYHGLGLQGRMTDSSDSIVNKIDRILTEETFVKNARAMKDIIGRRSERLTKVEEVLKALGLKF
jgi:UDP:flavonoid glycosyltransferase YjiC (YdhE family)